MLLQLIIWRGFFPFMSGGSAHLILPPSKSSRCEFRSTRAVNSICKTWRVDMSHDQGLPSIYLRWNQAKHFRAVFNRPYLYPHYWTRTSLKWRFMRRNIIEKRFIVFEKTSSISFSCKLVPVHYREYDYGLLSVVKPQPDLSHIPARLLSQSQTAVKVKPNRNRNRNQNQNQSNWLFCTLNWKPL